MRYCSMFLLCSFLQAATFSPADEPNWENIRSRLAPVLERVPATGLMAIEVIPDSQAARLGIQPGDILTHYDGQPVTSHQDLSLFARTANNDMRTDIPIVINRRGEEIDQTLSVGPIGLRLEDVVEGEARKIPPRVGIVGPVPNHTQLQTRIRTREQSWYLVYSSNDRNNPGGWVHQCLMVDEEKTPTLRIQQQITAGSRPVSQDIVVRFQLDARLTPTAIDVSMDDRPVIEVRRETETLTGKRVGVPVRLPFASDTVSSYLVPFLAASMAQGGTERLDMSLLPPLGLEPAPLCDLVRLVADAKGATFALHKLGRDEMAVAVGPDGAVRSVRMAGGIQLNLASKEQVLAAFPQADSAFTPIDVLPARAPASNAAQAN